MIMCVCLSVQDLSYYCCIELQGDEDKLLACLSQLTSKETGKSLSCISLQIYEVYRYCKN